MERRWLLARPAHLAPIPQGWGRAGHRARQAHKEVATILAGDPGQGSPPCGNLVPSASPDGKLICENGKSGCRVGRSGKGWLDCRLLLS